MEIQFQLLEKNAEKPSSVALTDVYQKIPEGCQAPMVGDYVCIKYACPPERAGNIGHFKVISRHFFYCTYYDNNPEGEDRQQPDIIAIVEEAEDIPETRFRE